MKYALGLVLTFLCFELNAQVLVVQPETCKPEEIKILSGKEFPKGFVIIGASTFPRKGVAPLVERLNEDLKKNIRKFGKSKESCTMWVDFKSEIYDIKDKSGNSMKKDHIFFYALRPAFPAK